MVLSPGDKNETINHHNIVLCPQHKNCKER